MTTIRPYGEVRKDYILTRTESILRSGGFRGSRRDAKELACHEFDVFVADKRLRAITEPGFTRGFDNE